MSHVYVDSNAAGAGTGADWANAYTTLAAALTAKAAGDNFWVAHNHAETQASAMTLTSPGTAANPCTVMCVNSAGTVPPVSADLRTTATVTTTGANALTAGAGNTYWYGISFKSGSGAVTTSLNLNGAGINYFKSCSLEKLGTTATNSAINMGAISTGLATNYIFDNCSIVLGSASDRIRPGAPFIWKNSSVGAFTVSGLMQMQSHGVSIFDGVDFSSVDTLVQSPAGTGVFIFNNCKLKSGGSVLTANPTGAAQVYIVRADSSGTNHRHEKYSYTGTQTVETTIVRTGGASDGTTPISWKIATTANSKWILPYESLPIAVWNDTTAANVTVTVYGFWDSASVPNNDDIWIEVSYLGASTSPLATINTANTKADFLAANAAQGTDTSEWGGGDTTTPFKMSVTLSSPQPAQNGALYVTVKAAKASTTFYVDPKIELT